MKKEIIERLKALGADVDGVTGHSLKDDLCTIQFKTVLYKKPVDTPWATAEEQEPIEGISDYVEVNRTQYEANKEAFFHALFDTYFKLTEEPFGQLFWVGKRFTPFLEGSEHYAQWYDWFSDEDCINLDALVARTGEEKPEFIQIAETSSYPDYFFVMTNDPNQDNPIVFSTTTEEFFLEVENEGTLEQFLTTFWTKDELRIVIERAMQL